MIDQIKAIKKSALLILIIIISKSIVAQNDTVQTDSLKEVVISANRINEFQQSIFKQHIAVEKLNQYGHHDLGEALLDLTNINITSYGGAGATAGISIRGTQADHTVVLWNGFAINSLSVGETDASTISTIAGDEVSVVYGGSSTLYGSGSFGGAILLDNKPNWSGRTNAMYQFKAGSFKDHQHNVALSTGNQKVNYKIKGRFHMAENNFSYIDRYKVNRPEVTQTHNASRNFAIVQNIFTKLKNNNSVNAGLWIQQKRKDLPETMGSFTTSNSNQTEFTTRTFFEWNKVFDNGVLNYSSALFYDNFRYEDKQNATDDFFLIDSKLISYRYVNKANYKHQFKKGFKTNIGAAFNFLALNTTNYVFNPREKVTSLYADVSYQKDKFTWLASIRQEIEKDNTSLPIFSSSIQYKLLKEHIVIQASAAQKFRRPDFNERYWVNTDAVGNPDLENENGWGAEIGWKGQVFKESQPLQFNYLLNAYYTQINQGIIWSLTDVWSPNNVEQLRTMGVESQLKISYTVNSKIKLPVEMNYHFNHSGRTDSEFKLAYRPAHTFKTNWGLNHKYIDANINWAYIGQRYTDESENELFALQPYHLLHMGLFGKLKHKSANFLVGFEVKNLLNTAYEIRRTFAQPGRAFYVSLSVQFKQPKDKL